MKKVVVIIALLLLLTGCSNVKYLNYDKIIQEFSTSVSNSNIYRTGYKYYLPRGMEVSKSTLYNEVLTDNSYVYYLYVDVVSYYNDIKESYEVNKEAVYSQGISYNDKFGYVEINLTKNDKYLVEIMYNYAKIEVIVDKDDCNQAMLSIISILKSIEYNNSIIANILGDDILNYSEEEIDIFKTHGSDDNYIQAREDYVQVEEKIPDTDLIN